MTTTPPATALNPITVEVLRHAFLSTAEEMKINLARTAYNPLIYEVLDFSCGVFDRRCRVIAQADGLPGFLGHLGYAVRRVVADVGEDALRPGDLYLMNDPYEQGTHINDVTTIEPVFHDGELVSYVVTRAHWLDIGAVDPGGSITTTDVVQEGLWMRSVRLYEEGRLNQSVWRLIEYNIRYRDRMLGDLRAQVASSRTGARRMREVVERHGLETVEAAIDEIIRQGEERTRAAIREMRDGVYEAEGKLDDDCVGNGPLTIRVRATVSGDEIEVDLAGSSPQTPGSTNAPYPASLCCCRIALKAFTNPHRPACEGDFAPLTLKAPEGSIVAATYPAPSFTIANILTLLTDLVRAALSQAQPGKAMGGHFGNLSAYTLFGDDPATGELYIQQEPLYGGWGATETRDGENAMTFMPNGDCRVLPVETMEARFPLRMERFSLRPDSGGPGRFRGGLGTMREIRPLGHTTHLMAVNDRSVDPPWGVLGGRPAQHCEAVLLREGQEPVVTGKTQAMPVGPDTVVSLRTGGGGGCGDPLERPVEAVRRDVVSGYVTVEAARRDYCVVIDPETLEVDEEATRALRGSMS